PGCGAGGVYERQPDEGLREERHRAAAVRKDECDVATALGGAAEDDAGDRARRVGTPLDDRLRDVGDELAAAVRGRRVGISDRAATVQLVHDLSERGIPEPLVAVART